MYSEKTATALENLNTFIGYDKKKGVQFGSGSEPARTLSFYTAETTCCGVKRVEVDCSMGSGGDATLDVYLAGDFIGNTEDLTDATETYVYELDEPQAGGVEIVFSNTSKAIYVKRIAIFYEYIDPITPVDPTSIESISTQTNTTWRKVLQDGQLYIIRDNEVYNVMGIKLR